MNNFGRIGPTPVKQQDGSTRYFNSDGQLHRKNGPAIEFADGTKHWYFKGVLHRVGGPAIEQADGTKQWWENGLPHRADGPAMEWPNGRKDWFLNGQEVSESAVVSQVAQALI